MHSAEKVRDTTLKMHRNMTSVLLTALCNQPEAFSLDLGDDQSRYLLINVSKQSYCYEVALISFCR